MGLLTRSPAERRRRRQRGMMWVLTGMTTVALLVIAVIIADIAKVPGAAKPAAARAAALSVRARAMDAESSRPRRPAPSVSPSPSASPSPSVSASPSGSVQVGQVTDNSSGLSYPLLSTPWSPGCPYALNTPMFSWSAGESALAGQALVAGSAANWYGNACSGLLGQQFEYSNVGDLEPTAIGVADALDLAYYSGLPHYRTVQDSYGMQVSGYQAWVVTFLMTYPDAASEGLAWTSEAGAVVLVDRGDGQVPAVFYVSAPSNLGTSAVDVLLSGLSFG
jgi:hypothetical protein